MKRFLRSTRITPLLALSMAFAWAGAASAADLTIVANMTMRGDTTTTTAYYTENQILTSDGRTDSVIDYGNEKMLVIDHKKKTWSEITFAEMRAKSAELDGMLEDNPMLANMFGGASDATVEKQGGTRTVAGHTCQGYRVTLGAKMQYDLCAAPDIEAPVNYYEARKMATLMMGPMASRLNKLYDAMEQIDGFPIAFDMNIKVMGMNIDMSSEATEVKASVPDDAFVVPSGYKQKKAKF